MKKRSPTSPNATMGGSTVLPPASSSVRSSGWGGSSMAARCGRDEDGWQLVSDNPAYKPLPFECSLVGLMRSRDKRGEIPNSLKVIVWAQQLEVLFEVEPLVRCAFNGSVIEIESIDVDDGSRIIGGHNKKGDHIGRPTGQ